MRRDSGSLDQKLHEVLRLLPVPGMLLLIPVSGLPTRLCPGSTPNPFHSDDLMPIGLEPERIAKVLAKGLAIATGNLRHSQVRATVREETMQRSNEPLQAWVLRVQRKGRRAVYAKGLFVRNGVVLLLSLHESERD